MKKNLQLIELYLQEKKQICKAIDINSINKIFQKVLNTYKKNGFVYLMANGGPAGIIDSVSTDLRLHPFVQEDKSKIIKDIKKLKVASLIESPGTITGISNDIGFENVFIEQLKNYVYHPKYNKNDVLISFSGSGNSENIIRAINYAKKNKVYTVCISGRGGGRIKKISDLCVLVPGSSKFPGQTGKNDNNFHIEDFQTSIMHMVTGLLKKYIDDKKKV